MVWRLCLFFSVVPGAHPKYNTNQFGGKEFYVGNNTLNAISNPNWASHNAEKLRRFCFVLNRLADAKILRMAPRYGHNGNRDTLGH